MDSHRARIAVALCSVSLVAFACDPRDEPPADPRQDGATSEDWQADPARSKLSEAGLYRVTFRPEDGGVPLGRIHGWIVHLETPDGETFVPPRFAVSGGMPQHAHGFETEPRVTRALGNGDFLIEGVRFHMAGDWTLRLEFVGPAGPDVAMFHVQVGP